MAYARVCQIGDYCVLRRGDTFYITVHSALKKRRIYRSLHTKDYATAVSAVQYLAELRAEGLLDVAR